MSSADDHSSSDPRVARLIALRRERAEVEGSLPKHSVPAAMLVRLEDLDDEIAALEAELAASNGDHVPG